MKKSNKPNITDNNNLSLVSFNRFFLKKLGLIFIFLNGFVFSVHAATYYSRGSNVNWNAPSSWSTSACGGTAATSIPGATDDVIICSGTEINVNVNASCNNLTIYGTGILDFTTNGRTLTVNGNLVMDGTAVISGNNNSRVLNINGSFTVLATATNARIGGIQLNVTGTTTVNGVLDFNDATGDKTLNGNVVVNGTWNTTANESFTLSGDLTNNGTFNGGNGTYTLTGVGKSIGGTSSITIATLDISTGASYTNNLLSPNYLYIYDNGAGDLRGVGGTFIQAVNAELRIADDITISTLDATANPNTVIYNGGTGQNVKATTYHHLIINKSGVSSANVAGNNPGTITVNGTLSILGGELQLNDNGDIVMVNTGGNTIINGSSAYLDLAANNATANLGDLTLTNGGSIFRNGGATGTVNATSLLVSGTGGNINRCIFTVSGTSTINAPLIFNSDMGIKTFQGTVTVNSNGSWTSSGTNGITTSANLVFWNGIVSNGASFSAGGATFNTNHQSISGSTPLYFSEVVTVTGAGVGVTNNTTVSMTNTGAGTLTGTGTWIQGANSTLNYSGSTITIASLNASASGNTVDYNRTDGNQTIFNPSAGTYYHLTLSGINNQTKTLSANVDVNGNLTIADEAIFSVSTFDVTLAGNWINSSTNADPFIQGTRTVTFDGSSAQIVSNTGDQQGTEFYNVTIANTSSTGVTLTGSSGNHLIIHSGGTLTLTDGYVYSNSNNIVLINNGASSTPGSSASFIDGPVGKIGNSSFVFPTGKDVSPTGSGVEDVWARIQISAPATATTQFTARYYFTPYSDLTMDATLANVSQIEYWTLDRTGSTDAVNVTLYFENATRSGITDFTSTDLVVAKYNGADWTDNGQSAISGTNPGWVRSTLVSSFSPFSFGSKGGINPLPVEILSFDAKRNGNVVDITWTTASEQNSDYFVVQRSKDGNEFEDVQRVDAAGNSTTIRSYLATDYEPYKEISYYRLKQVDNDGTYKFSAMIAVKFDVDFSMSVYPNPSSGKFNVAIQAKEGEEALVVLRDLLGKECYSKVIVLSNDTEVVAVDKEGKLPAGIYIVTSSSNHSISEKKIVIR